MDFTLQLGIRRVLDWNKSLSEEQKEQLINKLYPMVRTHYENNGCVEDMVKMIQKEIK